MSADIRSISDSSRLDAAVARVVQDAQRGRVRPGEALNLGELAERLRVRPAQLRHGLEGLRRSDLFDVRQDVLVVAPLDLRELRAGINILLGVASDIIARASDRITVDQVGQLQRFVTAMPDKAPADADLYDAGRAFTQQLIGVVASRYERELYTHTCDMVRRYEELGAVVLEHAGEAPALSTQERGLIRVEACQGLVDLCRADAANEVALSVRNYYVWAGQVAELSFQSADVSVRRILRSVG